MKFLLVLSITLLATILVKCDKRRVSCDGTQKQIDPDIYQLYRSTFTLFSDSSTRYANDTLNFESIGGISGITAESVDFQEYLVTLNRIQQQILPDSVNISQIKPIWMSTWKSLADILVDEAFDFLGNQHFASAASSLFRASSYYQEAIRYADFNDPQAEQIFNLSVQYFQDAHKIRSPEYSYCSFVQIPYTDEQGSHYLHGYWCPVVQTATPSQQLPTIMIQSGFDGTIEQLYFRVVHLALSRNFNVLVFEGPGQGSVARFQRVLFRPDWEFVIKQVIAYVKTLDNVDPNNLILWGLSMGGYLVPRAYSYIPELKAAVADGGVQDFFQTIICKFPENIQDSYYNGDTATVDKFGEIARQYAISIDFLFTWGLIGMNVTTFSQFLDYLQPFYNNNMNGLAQRAILVTDPYLETSTGNASQIFFSQLPQPTSSNQQMLTLDWQRGAALHCGIGSINGYQYILNWLEDITSSNVQLKKK